MIKTTREQRVALFKVFQRDFPNWITPHKRHIPGYPRAIIPVSSVQYRRFRAKVHPGPGCIMIQSGSMWLGIEPDGYTHS